MKERSAMVGVAVAVLMATGSLTLLERPTPSFAPSSAARRASDKQSPTKHRGFCGTGDFTEREADLIDLFVRSEARRQARQPGNLVPSIGTIQVVFHVIYVQDAFGFTTGLLSQADIDAQMVVLNSSFDAVDFELAGVTFTNNADWFLMTQGSHAERQAKTALRWDNRRYLNIYTCQGLGGNNPLGWATYPWQILFNPTNDGVVVSFATFPGGFAPFNEGETLVHEVGHWCGLFHTFQGGCSLLNDRVADTPAELSANFGCPVFRDTCPAAGSDPIDNFMDYSDDVCLQRFTDGQGTRKSFMLQLFRRQAFVGSGTD